MPTPRTDSRQRSQQASNRRPSAKSSARQESPAKQITHSQPLNPWIKRGVIAAIIIVLLCLINASVVSHFQSHLFPNTSVGATQLGGADYATANAKIPQAVQTYSLTVKYNGAENTFVAADLGIAPAQVTVQSLGLTGNVAAWPLELFAPHKATLDKAATIDVQKLSDAVAAFVSQQNQNVQAPTAASLNYNQQTDSMEVSPATESTMLSQSAVMSKVSSAVMQWQTSVTLDQNDFTTSTAEGPTTQQLQSQADQINQLLSFNFTLELGSSGAYRVTKKDGINWIAVDSQNKVTLDESKYQEWLQRLSDSLNTIGGTHEYTRADGKEVTVSGGTYGWSVDEDTLKSAVDSAIKSKSTGAIHIECEVEGNGYQGPYGPDCGKYADVDITQQHAILYDADGTILWETDVITGYDNGVYDTPTGFYVINSKESPSVLQSSATSTVKNDKGEEEEVVTTYRHEVSYWMPFITNFIGFHDATWQDAGWGGDLYHDVRYGSGGCVNLPLDKAAELWDLMEVGTPVSVHF